MYDPVYELEHFGVPGMKWGVRRTPAQLGRRKEAKLERYKTKEIGKIEKRMAKTDKKYKVWEEDARKRKMDYFSKSSPTSKEKKDREEQRRFDTNMKKAFDSIKKSDLKEIEAIKKMSYKDMQREKIDVGVNVVSAIVGSFGSAAIAKLSPAPVSFYYVTTPNPSAVKSKIRLSKEGGPQKQKKKPNVTK